MDQEDRNGMLAKQHKRSEIDLEALKKQLSDNETVIRRFEVERHSRDEQMRSLQVSIFILEASE